MAEDDYSGQPPYADSIYDLRERLVELETKFDKLLQMLQSEPALYINYKKAMKP